MQVAVLHRLPLISRPLLWVINTLTLIKKKGGLVKAEGVFDNLHETTRNSVDFSAKVIGSL